MNDQQEEKRYSVENMKIALLNRSKIDGISTSGCAYIRINKLAPYIVLCLHSGRKVSKNIEQKMAISELERGYEEDPFIDQLFQEHPINLIALHSRYEFDLNRTAEKAIYITPDICWGVNVFKEKLTPDEIDNIMHKYQEFYCIIDLIVSTIIDHFGICVIYDIHSYNATHRDRVDKELPAINLGTMTLNHQKFRSIIDHWLAELNNVKITGVSGGASENCVFGGRGGMAKYISSTYPDALIFPTEIRKFFHDECSLVVNEPLLQELKIEMNKAILNNVNFVIKDRQVKQSFIDLL